VATVIRARRRANMDSLSIDLSAQIVHRLLYSISGADEYRIFAEAIQRTDC
jgi:hypothetical protein